MPAPRNPRTGRSATPIAFAAILAAGGLFGAGSVLAPTPLSAQLVEFPFQVEEGAVFLRTVTMTGHVTGPGGEQTQETAITVRLRVREAGADGSGRLEFLVEEVSPPEPADTDGAAPPSSPSEEDPVADLLHAMVGRPLEMGLTAGGLLDPADIARAAGRSEAEMIESIFLMSLFGPQDRADGLLASFPPALREDAPFVSAIQLNVGGGVPLQHTLAGVDTSNGGRIARVELRGEADYGERGSGEATGFILFDLDAGRLVESRMTSSMTLGSPEGQAMRRTMETRTQRVPG